jgi:ABC-type polysaccharide/polyol phosphate export permease
MRRGNFEVPMSQQSLNKNYKSRELLSALAAYDLWFYLAWLDIRLRYRRSTIGPLWITISMTIFCVILGVVYSQLWKADISEYLPFLSVGYVMWMLFSSMLSDFPNLYVENASFLKDTKMNPLTILFRVVARNVLTFLHNALIIIGIYLYFKIVPGIVVVLVIPGLLLVLLNLIVIGVSLSIIGARFRDITQITQSVIQILFFVTPIMYFPRLVTSNSWVLTVNPFAYYLDLVRSPLLGSSPAPQSWLVATLTLALLSIFAAWLYKRKSHRIPFWV